jgi:carboxyl-terminal processing protease
MKKYTISAAIIAATTFLFGFNQDDSVLKNNDPTDDSKEIFRKRYVQSTVFKALEVSHYHPPTLNDAFSKKAFNEYVETLDYNKQFLLQEDVDNLKIYETSIDDLINSNGIDLYLAAQDIYHKRYKVVKEFYQEILSKPFDYEVEEEYETDSDKLNWAKSEEELKERWRKSLKFSTIARIYNRQKPSEEKDDKKEKNSDQKEEKKTSWEDIEKASREAVEKNIANYFKRLDKIKDEDLFESYINSLLAVVDPHTVYLAPKSKEDFNISMSGKLEGIGARLSQSDGEIKVIEIVPGSPCEIQGELEIEDIILKAAEKDEEPTSLEDMLLSDAIRFIRGKKGTEVTLTVRKIDGSIKNIPIVRDVVLNKETYAKSALIQKDSKIGYIKLPKFYVDFSNRNGRRCSTDMKNEINKLKDEGAESLIIDLRNNGGGSLSDVVDIAGYFIEKGPIVQVKNYDGTKRILRDRDKDILFNGRVVVMINKFSASASEILAGALKDYDRAIIMGSEQTFGKGTVQNVINFDNQLRNKPPNIGQIGSLKITTNKFYRINGETTQKKGVPSDIVLPDNYMFVDIGESDRKYALEYDKIKEEDHKEYPNWMSEKQINKFTSKNVKTNPIFNYIKENAKELKEKRDDSMISLNYAKYKKERSDSEKNTDEYNELIKTQADSLVVTNLEIDLKEICTDSTMTKLNDKWIKSVEKDIYIQEAVDVLNY